MWLFVFFDLPVMGAHDRRAYTLFRKQLIRFGFSMQQYSVYVTHSPTNEVADGYTQKVSKIVPNKGTVSILRVSDPQFGNMVNIEGQKRVKSPKAPKQLQLF
jgi:CRISPR-associated protein Cas2